MRRLRRKECADDFLIAVSGDAHRDHAMICDQNGPHGWPVSKKIQLPANWAALLEKARVEREKRLEKLESRFWSLLQSTAP